jgi:hypothetical protein
MSIQQLLTLATELSDAADQEDWERLAPMLLQFDQLAKNIRYKPADKITLLSALDKLKMAVESTTRRKEEIRKLVNNLSDSPV